MKKTLLTAALLGASLFTASASAADWKSYQTNQGFTITHDDYQALKFDEYNLHFRTEVVTIGDTNVVRWASKETSCKNVRDQYYVAVNRQKMIALFACASDSTYVILPLSDEAQYHTLSEMLTEWEVTLNVGTDTLEVDTDGFNEAIQLVQPAL